MCLNYADIECYKQSYNKHFILGKSVQKSSEITKEASFYFDWKPYNRVINRHNIIYMM